jgi:hypothetical protein
MKMSRAMNVAMADGQITSDVARKANIIESVVERKADLISVGVKVLPTKTYSGMDIAASFPGKLIGEYPLAAGTQARYERVGWTPYSYTLYKFEARWRISAEAKIRQQGQEDQNKAMNAAAGALAFWKDKEVLDKIIAGAYTTNNVTVSTGDEWDSGNPSADPEGDIVDAWNNLIANGYEDESGMSRISLVVPANVYGQINKQMLIGNVQQRIKDYIKSVYSIDVFPTRYTDQITHPPGSIYTLAGATTGISDDAYMLVYSDKVGELGIMQTNVIPMSGGELYNTGDEEWWIRQFFGAKIQPNSSSDATNVGIAKILNVT